MRRQRIAVKPAEREIAARLAVKQAARWLQRGSKIGTYIAVGSEFPTDLLIRKALAQRCAVFVPKTPKRGRMLRFSRVRSDSGWLAGRYTIPEPVSRRIDPPLHANQLDVIFVPLLGFDAALRRLGQGGGYYDATLQFRRLRRHWRKPFLIGLAFDCQEVDQLPTDPWDLHLDAIITESGLRYPARHWH